MLQFEACWDRQTKLPSSQITNVFFPSDPRDGFECRRCCRWQCLDEAGGQEARAQLGRDFRVMSLMAVGELGSNGEERRAPVGPLGPDDAKA